MSTSQPTATTESGAGEASGGTATEGGPLRALFEHMPDLMVVLDVSGSIVEINETAATLTGLPRAELGGRPYGDVSWPDGAGGSREELAGAIARAGAGEATRLEVDLRDEEGQPRSLELVLTGVAGEG